MSKYKQIIINFILLIIIPLILSAQVIEDPLQGSTIGTQVGGTLTSEGYKPGIGENHILYNVPTQIQNGYVEVQVKGFNFNHFSDTDSNSQTSFYVMYDGRGVPEPLQYKYDYRNNYFRFETVYRSAKPSSTSGNRFKGKIHTAADTPERLNSTHAVFPNDSEHPMDWAIEPNGLYASWNENTWYTIKTEWNNTTKDFKIYRNGIEVWHNKKDKGVPYSGDEHYSSTSPYPWLPVDFRIWLGSGPRQYSSKLPNLIYRNFKVVDLGGSSQVDTLNISPLERNVEASSGTTTFSIESNINWTINEDVDWFSVSPLSGNSDATITVTYDENSLFESRSGSINVTGGSLSRLANIIQSAAITDSIIANPDSINVSFMSGQTQFAVESNIAWTISSDSDWITFEPVDSIGNSVVLINYLQNNSNSERIGILTLQNGSVIETVKIVQEGSSYYVNLSPKNWSVSSGSGTVNFIIESNHNWNLNTTDDWIVPSIEDSSGNVSFSTYFMANTDTSNRVGTIYIESEYILDSVTISQEGANPIELMVSINPPEAGNVNGSGIYGKGSDVILVASGNPGWKFINWTEDSVEVFTDSLWSFKLSEPKSVIANFEIVTDIEENSFIPSNYSLSQNYPNPFNPSTTLSFSLPEHSMVNIILYNSLGQEIKQLANGNYSSGYYSLQLDASDLPSGIYIYKINAVGVSGINFVNTKKMILMK